MTANTRIRMFANRKKVLRASAPTTTKMSAFQWTIRHDDDSCSTLLQLISALFSLGKLCRMNEAISENSIYIFSLKTFVAIFSFYLWWFINVLCTTYNANLYAFWHHQNFLAFNCLLVFLICIIWRIDENRINT